MKDVLGEALTDQYHNTFTGKLWVHRAEHRSAGRKPPKEEMPVKVYFREAADMPELEWVALQQCKGKTMDIGAGAGSHALILQQMGFDVTALDISPKATAIMKERGVEKVLQKNFFELETTEGFDTLLLLMNGIGLAGTLDKLRLFFSKAQRLLRPGGRMIFDSTDIAYLYDGKPSKGPNYYGEILYQYEYKKQRSDWFKWLFIDRKTLKEIAGREGWKTELIFEDEWDQYLVRCTRQ